MGRRHRPPSQWQHLPDLLLERVYAQLSYRNRYYCSMVCKPWHDAFYFPYVWRTLEVDGHTFTYRRFNLYKGYQQELSPHRVQMYLSRVGRYIRNLVILPLHDYYNLSGFLHVLTSYFKFFEEYPMPDLQHFSFTFACESEGFGDTFIIGTGGQLLEGLKRLLANLKGLRSFTFNQLLLKTQDAHGLLDDIVNHCKDTLTHLEILNCTKERYPLFYVAMFKHLQQLTITPPQLSDDVVLMLVRSTPLKTLVIVQDKYTSAAESVSRKTWLLVKRIASKLHVRLELRGLCPTELLIQEGCPVRTILYDSRYTSVNANAIAGITNEYKKTLQVFGHLGLPKRHGKRSFSDRADTSLVLLVRQCPNIRTLVIRERISTATLLIIASEAKSLQNLYVRRNAVLKKRDWSHSMEWTQDFYNWLQETALSYEAVEREVSYKLGFDWHMLRDDSFQMLDRGVGALY